MYYWINNLDFLSDVKKIKGYEKNEYKIADLAVNNTFIFTDTYEMEKCKTPVVFEKIDWNHVPFGDPEWNFAFNRHSFLLHLAKSYALSKNEIYRSSFIRLFTDYYSRNSEVNEKNKSLSWRSLEAGIRVENYLRSYEIFSLIKPFDADFEALFSKALSLHVEYLKDNTDYKLVLSNWGILQDHGLFLASLFLGDDENAEKAIRRLDEEFDLQTLPDGMHWEQSSMYQAEVLHCGLDTVLVAKRNGISIPKRMYENVHKMALSLARTLRPDGQTYLFGDSDRIYMRDIIQIASLLFSDPVLSYYSGDKKFADFYWNFSAKTRLVKMQKEEKSRYFAESGNVIISLKKDVEVRFHAGPYGSGHGHLDQLHLDFYKKGVCFLSDTGRATYVASEPRFALKNTFGHNTIAINDKDMANLSGSWGLDVAAESYITRCIIKDDWSFTEAINLAYLKEGAFIRRRILTLSSDAAVVLDEITSDKLVKISSFWHTEKGVDVSLEKNRAELCAKKDKVLIVYDENANVRVEDYMFSDTYNEISSSKTIVRLDNASGIRSHAAVIFPSGEGSVEKTDAFKPLSGNTVSPSIANSYRITTNGNVYTLVVENRETMDDGSIISAGGVSSYARIFFRKNDEEIVRVLY